MKGRNRLPGRRRRPARATEPRGGRTRLALPAALLVAAGFAAWACAGWYASAHDEHVAYSRHRDAALDAAEQGVRNLNTLDHTELDHGLALWEESATGDLLGDLRRSRAQFSRQVRSARTTTSARVLSGALTELDDRAGRARAMVAVRVTVRTPDRKTAVKDSRMLAELTRTGGGWKLNALGQAPVGDTGTAGPDAAPDAE
ncbi:nuclear transport factor 2 family protein [Streptomyces sp. LP05-1]|uniref:Nuclear transport factor 2 family protein n=1 Tax=Streptomyces pyxinae TaxID=2970734 RepID=A0ABT2CEA8_9ACTN|nr:nuclear transport factor 2 family protein [Streptomyces sp. LP05-1]MCS0635735.1 nuclear transport factor 2 family protein [Streptomyces sp. LP05-1]